MTTAINEIKFADLKSKLRELFELDKSDLDFGIYRIMAAKNKEVTEFLDVHLRSVVRETLAAHGAGASSQVQAELDKVIAGLKAADMSDAEIDANKKVSDLRAKLGATGGASAAELEADIYNHLLAFFSRYYDEGDFISRRRYKGDTYAIPYSGEEVTLHWANKDQYYIKSGEWHQDYRFKLGNGNSVRFKLVAATAEVNNNKESDQSKRRYILRDADPVTMEGSELVLHFEFRTAAEAEKTRAGNGAVAIFGGKYATSTKGDEREQFCADAEKRALAAMPADWLPAVQKVVSDGPRKTATETKPLRTILGKQLDDFTARNTFDYFIHKDLGGFLSRELDFYIKNEVVRLDDIENLPADHLQRVQGKVKAIRAVASQVIAFLASIENFQKKLWLKKKLVLNTHWLVTIDRVPASLREEVVGCEEQWVRWEHLGFKPSEVSAGTPDWRTRAYVDANDKLPVDTSLFPPAFASVLLASFEVLSGKPTIDDATTGILVNSDNFQALMLLATRYLGQIQYSYIDPPYNTDVSAIPYKNNYQHSAFATMIRDRAALLCKVLSSNGVLMVSIDQTERTTVEHALDDAFGGANRVEELIWVQNTNDGRSPTYSTNHEYVEVYAKRRPVVEADARIFREPKPGFAEVAALVRELAPAYPPIQEIKTRLASLFRKRRKHEVSTNVAKSVVVDYSDGEKQTTALFGKAGVFLAPKHSNFVLNLARQASLPDGTVLDCFGGSGSTAHAVIDLNRLDNGNRRFLLVETNAYFHTLIKPRSSRLKSLTEFSN